MLYYFKCLEIIIYQSLSKNNFSLLIYNDLKISLLVCWFWVANSLMKYVNQYLRSPFTAATVPTYPLSNKRVLNIFANVGFNELSADSLQQASLFSHLSLNEMLYILHSHHLDEVLVLLAR